MKNGRVISTSSTPRPGVSVRATIHASRMASATARIVFTNDSTTVSNRIFAVSGVSSPI